MKNRLKIDVGTTSFGSCADRFVRKGYKKGYNFRKQLEMISKVEGITGVALDYPSQYDDPDKLRRLLNNAGLELGMTEIDMYSTEKWKFGSLSSNNDRLRKEAIALVKKGIDAAIEAKGADVQLWLGQDGYDYSFHDSRGSAEEMAHKLSHLKRVEPSLHSKLKEVQKMRFSGIGGDMRIV